jgi:hypothetical protein
LKLHRISDIRQIGILTAETLVPNSSPFDVEFDMAKLYKLPGSDKIQIKMFHIGGEIFLDDIHKLVNSTWSK